ncbi:tripartite tricarboxylate transporter substrate binding protein [Azohydromonas caseinilytica]|uniref:Tripartite tricarboxylate transporter substrate binding protein n=1 Tax=Azohydromonas caseinilytica TaxID=2728836 RepID=A0A848F622_9BURK|nr:tripartite tricarboxylate transporter substrate binding protein [Azohydromonas caseinilytica]NML14029.1 tripartite tricarboxylate transporter substrate binding protein [Azohydromonas caseinilytica]
MTAPAPWTRRRLLAASALLAAPALSRAAGAIAGGKPISLVVSYPPGGGADVMARLIAPRLAQALGQAVVVENKPGASGTIAATQVARATPDGSMLLLDASNYAVNPALFDKLPYDPASAFAPLAVLATFPNVLVCTPGFEAQSVADVLRLARARPNSLSYASSGNGSAQHLAGALFEQLAKVDLTHVPYRGGGPAMTDVMGGQVPLFFANVASALGHIQSRRLRPLAVTSKLRTRALPEVPTLEESGLKGYEVLEWNPVLAPAATPAPVRAKLAAALRSAMADPEVLARVRSLGGEVFTGDEKAAAAFLRQQQALWTQVVREHRITRE